MKLNKVPRKTLVLIIVASLMGLVVVAGIYGYKKSEELVEKWIPTFVNNETKPYDTYICYKTLKEMFDGKITMTRQPIYNNLKDSLETYFKYDDLSLSDQYDSRYNDDYTSPYNEDEWEDEEYEEEITTVDSALINNPLSFYDDTDLTDTSAYIFINRTFILDQVDLEYLLDYAGIGNNVFIAAEWIDVKLTDTLNIRTESDILSSDSIYHFVDNPKKKYNISPVFSNTWVDYSKSKLPIRALALDNKGNAVFIQIKYGKGNIYINTVPKAFTNILLIDKKRYDFSYRSLSCLPRNNNIIWDEYQTQGPTHSVFSEMLKQAHLIIALIIIGVGFLLFVVFRAKREQRTIPIIRPAVNSSIEFLDTISNLYYQKKDLTVIIQKRHAYFLDYIRRHFYLSTEVTDREFIAHLNVKSGVDIDDLNSIFDIYSDIKFGISNTEFLRYNRLLEAFYKKVKIK